MRRQFSGIALEASVSLAMALILSCSSDDGGGGGNSSSSETNGECYDFEASTKLASANKTSEVPTIMALGQGGETVELDVIIRDFPMSYPGFEEKDYQKITDNRQCGANGSTSTATKGMVQEKLDYSQCSAAEKTGATDIEKAINGRYCARPMPANPSPDKMCYGENLQSWFTDGSHTKTFKEVMTLARKNGLYEIDSAGYLPLDKYPDELTFGKENSDNRNQQHNYGFTVAGSTEFKYVQANNDMFAFIGDDDMWVFIDGVLVMDLGGVHSALEGSFSINDIANARGWADNSIHSLNFFYVERQTVESNLRLRFNLTDLSSSKFSAPRILKAQTDDGATMIWVSNKLDMASIEKFIGSDQFPIIIKKSDPNNKNVNGYKLSSIEFISTDDYGYIYKITGGAISSGDSLSFNVKSDELLGYTNIDNVALPSDSWYVKSAEEIPSTKISWAPNATKIPPIIFEPVLGDNNPIKPPFDMAAWFTGNPTDASCANCGPLPNNGSFPNINYIWDPIQAAMVTPSTNRTVHGFGPAGTSIPPQRAGELVLTAFPNASGIVNTINGSMAYAEWYENKALQKLFGLPPEVSDYGPYGIVDPKVQAPDGGYQFVKNGFPNESSAGGIGQIAPTRCVSDRSKLDEPRINCLNFSLLTTQPFKLSVTLYDQRGNLVTQYLETITEKELRSIVQGPNYAPEERSYVAQLSKNSNQMCQAPTASNYGMPNVLTTNGLVKVNVNIYPFSKNGNRFSNGAYTAKIDMVELPYEGCMNNAGMPIYITEPYKCHHAELKFDWINSN